jgi:hypothetical protein
VRELTIEVTAEEEAHLAGRHAFIAHHDEILNASHGSRLLNKLAAAAQANQASLVAHVAAGGEAAGTVSCPPSAVPAAGPPPSRGSQRHAGEARPLPGVGHQSSADPGPRVGDRAGSCAECAGRAGSPSSGPPGADLSRPGAAVVIALWLIILAAAALAWLVLT